jgi:ribonuclease HI
VDEFLSTIQRETGDPAIAGKLVRFVERLVKGAAIDRAAREASLERDLAVRFLESVRAALPATDTGNPAAAKPARASTARSAPRRKMNRSVGRLTAFTDGASRGNPGEASCAVVIYDDSDEELLRRAKKLGVTTNNVAEYEGVILALELAATLSAAKLRIKLDSELVARQLNGVYKVKHPALKPLHARAKLLIRDFDAVEIIHISREKNKVVDKLANEELDGKT